MACTEFGPGGDDWSQPVERRTAVHLWHEVGLLAFIGDYNIEVDYQGYVNYNEFIEHPRFRYIKDSIRGRNGLFRVLHAPWLKSRSWWEEHKEILYVKVEYRDSLDSSHVVAVVRSFIKILALAKMPGADKQIRHPFLDDDRWRFVVRDDKIYISFAQLMSTTPFEKMNWLTMLKILHDNSFIVRDCHKSPNPACAWIPQGYSIDLWKAGVAIQNDEHDAEVVEWLESEAKKSIKPSSNST